MKPPPRRNGPSRRLQTRYCGRVRVAQRRDVVAAVVVDDEQPAAGREHAVHLGEVALLHAGEARPEAHQRVERPVRQVDPEGSSLERRCHDDRLGAACAEAVQPRGAGHVEDGHGGAGQRAQRLERTGKSCPRCP